MTRADPHLAPLLTAPDSNKVDESETMVGTLASAGTRTDFLPNLSITNAVGGEVLEYATDDGLGLTATTVTAEDGITTRVHQNDLSLTQVNIPDTNLRDAVRLALGIPSLGLISEKALQSLDVLDVSRSEVTSLAGLEGAFQLRELFLGSNRITDLSPLNGLPVTVRHTHSPGVRNQEWGEDDLWQPVAILPSLDDDRIGHGRAFMVDGHLVLITAHDGPSPLEFPARVDVWDLSEPRSPRLVKTHTDVTRRLREAHGFGLWNRDGQIILAAQTHRGIAFYEVTEISSRLTLLGELALFGEEREGYAGSWWVAMQAPYAYVAAIGGGLYVVDASDLSNPVLVRHLETGELGGISPGSVFAVGGLLVLAEAGNRGFATMDISDPANPAFIEARDGATSYSHMFTAGLVLSSGGDQGPGRMYVHRVGHDGHIVYAGEAGHTLWDGGYGAYQDGHFFSGFSLSAAKFSLDPLVQVGKGSSKVADSDQDFVSPLGNLLFVGDDHGVGSSLMPHQAGRDTSGPEVEWVHPADGATGVAVTTAIGVSMSEEVGIESLTADRFRVRPSGGEPVSGQLSAGLNNLNFVPDSPLAPGTVHEVEVCGLSDLVGNAGGCDTSVFTTRDPGSDPPVCRLGPFEAVEVGTAVDYLPASATGEPEAYTWDFGDGGVAGPQPAAQATTTYTAPGRYTVTLTVTNANGKSNCGAVRIVHNPLTTDAPTGAGASVSSSSIAVAFKLGRENRGGDRLRYTDVYVVNRDNHSVSRISTSDDRAWTPEKSAWETAVCERPRTLTVAPDREIWVACQGSGEIAVLNRHGVVVKMIDLGYGAAPYGVVFAPDGSAAYVTLAGSGRLLKLSPGGAVAGELAIGPHPRGVAVSGDSSRIFVTRFVSGYADSDGSGSDDATGELYEVDAASFSVVRTLGLAFDPGPDGESSGRGVPNYLSQVRIAPDGRTAWIPSKKDNIARGVQRDGNQLDFETQTRAIVSQVDLVGNAETLDRRIDFNDRDLPQSMVFTPAGDAFIVAFQGSNAIEVWDANALRRMSQLPVGRAPDGIAMRPDGRRLYVHNFLDRSVSIFDTAGLLDGTSSQPIPVRVVAAVAEEALEPAVLRGKRIFYNAADPRMSRDGYISCASCHLDGGSDGMVWDRTQFGEGLRNTIGLRGRRGTNGGFVHWTANFDEIQDFEHDMRASFGGAGFMDATDFASGTRNDPLGDSKAGISAGLDDLAAYVTSLAEYPDSPYRQQDGSLTEAGARGKAVFQARQCVLCHQGPHFTDDGTHNVGTLETSSGLASGGSLEGINTPTLKGLWESAPYLHNGAVATLAEVLGNAVHTGGELTAQEKTDLEAYLLQIDRNENAGTAGPLGTGKLRNLVLSGVDIGVFDSETTAYRGSVGGGVSTTTVTAVASEANAVVEIVPADADALEPGHQVRLGEGANAIALKVTAEDGQTNTTYTVTVIRLMIPLTASFASLPDAHTGSGTVQLRIQFSEPIGTSYQTLQDSSFAVTNGKVRSAERVNRRDDLWKINIGPFSSKDMLVVLPATDHCAATGAICTRAGRRLSHGLQAVIPGPVRPMISISAMAATVTEGTPAAFEFILDGVAPTDLTIEASVTESGSVLAPFVPTPVTIAAGHTSATLRLPTTGDLEVETDSTVTVEVTGGPGYRVGEDSSASVTVRDDDVATFTVAAAPEAIAEGETSTLTVAISNEVTFAEAQTIGLSVAGEVSASDYALPPAGLTLAGGATQATATFRAVDDEEEEPAESATVTVSVDGEEVGSATLTVLASDQLTGLWLAAATTLKKIEAIEDGGTLMMGSDTPARTTLLAETGVSARSVRLELAGPVSAARSDAEAPYTLHGPGDAMALVPGDYRADVTVMTGDEAGKQDSETHSAAFAVRRWARAAGRDISTLEAAGNTDPQGLWGDGETLWVADHVGGRVYAYALADGGRLPEREIDTAAAGNARPVGLWSNGETLWAGDSEDGRLYAYALADGERQPDRDVDLGGGSVQDLWGDGATLWVLQGRGVAAYGLDGARQPQRDVALDAVNGWPTGLWSDGARLLVTDVGRRPWLYVYRDGALSPVEGLGLSSGGEFPQVPWSDGQTLWVADDQSATLHSYALEPPSSNATLTLLRLSNVALDAYAPLTTRYAGETVAARTTLTAYGASGAHLAITPADADTAAPGHQVDLAEGANEIRVTVTAADGTTTRTYAVTVTRSAESAESDARLSALTLEDVELDGFDSDVYEYWVTAGSEVAATVVGATPLQESAVVTVTPEDADAQTPGHQVALAEGANEIRVTVTAADETTTRTYAVTVTRAAVPLTARWAALPERHDGAATVRLRVAFSEPVTTGFAALRDHAFEVTNGSLTDARRVDGRSDLRELDVLPASDAELVLVLPVTTDCAAVGAVCTASYKPLSNRLEARIPGSAGPEEPAVAVTLTADAASVTEGTAAAFTATLSEALSGPLTVPVTVTSAGEVLSGTPPASVTFAAGDTSATLEVPTDDDSVVEGDGMVTVSLTAGDGYTLGEASAASVTVEDDDVAAWSVTAEPAGIAEGGSATLTVSIGNGVTYAQAQTIALSVDGEVSASDYTLSAASLALSAGATSATATLTAIDDEASEGPERATVTAHLDGAAIGSVVVTVDDAAPLETPVVSGVVQVGEALTASMDGGQVSTVVKASASGTSAKAMSVKALSAKSAKSASPKSASVTYQWLRDGSEMAGATGLSYVLTAADVGASMSVRVTRGGRTATSAATIPIWDAPWNPPVGADEEELFPALLTVGSTGAYSLPLGGYGRMSKASFGALDDTVLRVDGVAHRVTVAALNNVGQFALGTEPDLDDTRGWSVYWDGHRIDRLSLKRSSEGALWLGEAPTVYERYLRGSSDGVRVALSIRRALPTPVATLAAVGDSVDEGSGAVFEVTLDRARAAALEIAVEVTVEGEVVSGEMPSAVTVVAGSTTARLEVSTDDDSVVEEDGSVTATLVEGGGYALGEAVAATVAVVDDDVAAWTVTASPAELVEGGSATLAVSTGTGVTFATERTLELSVTGDVSESDYALEAGTLALEAGTDTATATFEARSDGVEETPEVARLGVALDGTEVASTEMTVRDASADASLSSLLLTDVDIGEFDAERTAYAATVTAGVSTTTVTAEPSDANAAVAIADALGSTQGTQRTSSLATGANEIAATVTAEDASTVRTYTVSVTRLPGWGTRLPERDIALAGVEATGVWSDGTTLWAAESDGEAAQAYDLATGARRSADDIALTAKRYVTTALWSEDGTLWVANALGEAVAYRLSDGARVASADLDGMLSSAGNGEPVGLWSDGSVLYVVDRADKHLYAYASDGERLPDREYGLDREERSRAQWGLWSDGETLLTSGSSGYVVAYRLSDGARLLDRDIDLGMIGYGLWSDGETLWVADSLLPRVLAYAVPGLRRASGSGLLPVVVTNRAVGVPTVDPGVPVAIPDAGLRGRIAVALGKSAEDPVGVNELLALQSLDARGAGVADLTGLAYAVNLRAVDLSHNPLVDLRVLGSLPNLSVLNLDGTGAEPWALAGLVGLERLSLRDNGIADVSALANLHRLRALDLGANAIEDPGPLAGLGALETLDLGDNRIGDATLLAPLRATIELRGNPAGSGRATDAGGAP